MSAAGGLYWWHVISPIRPTFAPESFYGFYEDQPRFWGLSAQEDQSIAGAIMAIEQSIVMGIALTYLFVKLLRESEKEEERTERYADAPS